MRGPKVLKNAVLTHVGGNMYFMHRQRTVIRLYAITAFFGSAVYVAGQSDFGSIIGFARDPSGAVVPRAKVVVKNEGTGEEHAISTNDAGHYAVPSLQPGYYAVAMEAGGFKKFESAHNKLDANTTLKVDASLVVGLNTETVEVSAGQPSCKRIRAPSKARSPAHRSRCRCRS
jgi:hypothetical protein